MQSLCWEGLAGSRWLFICFQNPQTLEPTPIFFQVLPQVLPQMQPELPEERRESPRHASLPGGSGRGLTLQTCPLLTAGFRGTPAARERPPGQLAAQPSPAQGLLPAGGGVAPSQLLPAARGGFIRAPLKEMLIVTFLHD